MQGWYKPSLARQSLSFRCRRGWRMRLVQARGWAPPHGLYSSLKTRGQSPPGSYASALGQASDRRCRFICQTLSLFDVGGAGPQDYNISHLSNSDFRGKFNVTVEIVEKVASLSLELFGKAHESHKSTNTNNIHCAASYAAQFVIEYLLAICWEHHNITWHYKCSAPQLTTLIYPCMYFRHASEYQSPPHKSIATWTLPTSHRDAYSAYRAAERGEFLMINLLLDNYSRLIDEIIQP